MGVVSAARGQNGAVWDGASQDPHWRNGTDPPCDPRCSGVALVHLRTNCAVRDTAGKRPNVPRKCYP